MFGLNLSSPWCSHVGVLFTNEEQKKHWAKNGEKKRGKKGRTHCHDCFYDSNVDLRITGPEIVCIIFVVAVVHDDSSLWFPFKLILS